MKLTFSVQRTAYECFKIGIEKNGTQHPTRLVIVDEASQCVCVWPSNFIGDKELSCQ